MAWLAPPELPVGVEPELRPPELELELPVLEPEFAELEPELVPVELEPELPELEPVEPELLPELEPELELAEEEPDPLDVLALLAEPGSARASAPAVTTLATVTAVVVDRPWTGRAPWPPRPGGFRRLGVRRSCHPSCGPVFRDPCTNPLGQL